MPRWNYSPWIFLLALLVCYAVSVNVRYQQFVSWQKNPKAYFVGDRPMMTTLDAPYWLRMAREYNKGIYGKTNYEIIPQAPLNFLKNKLKNKIDLFQMNSEL